MNRESFEKLDIIQQIEFVNEKLKEGYSLSRLAKEGITSASSTMRDRYERVHYKYNKDTKQFENIVEIMPSVNDEICVTKDGSNKVVISENNIQECSSSNKVVITEQVNNKVLEQILLNYNSMSSKLDEVYNWYQKSSNKVVTGDLNIDNFEGKVVTRSYKIYEDVQKEFAEFCASSKYRVQDILTQAIKEFLEKYK